MVEMDELVYSFLCRSGNFVVQRLKIAVLIYYYEGLLFDLLSELVNYEINRHVIKCFPDPRILGEFRDLTVTYLSWHSAMNGLEFLFAMRRFQLGML